MSEPSTDPVTSGPPAPGARSSSVRSSTEEREQIVTALHRACGEGRLTLEETEKRVAATYATSYRDELYPLLADLPECERTAGQGLERVLSWSELWSAAIWRIRILLWGPDVGRPTPRHRRVATVTVLIAAVWTVCCALLAALMVGA